MKQTLPHSTVSCPLLILDLMKHGVFNKLANGRLPGRRAVLVLINKPYSWRRGSSSLHSI